jgi:hypothetical protein
MNDDFMYRLKGAPPQEFARRLRAHLAALDAAPRARPKRPVAHWLAVAASLAVVGFAFTLPAVRAGAEAFLDLFRVNNVAGVGFDMQRLQDLAETGFDLTGVIGEQVEVLAEPGPPTSYGTLAEAAAAAGIPARSPAWLPPGLEVTAIEVLGEHAARITASGTKLRELLAALEIDDLAVPPEIDGEEILVRVPPMVSMRWENNGDTAVTLLQGRGPDVQFPAGFDLPALAEIALRILGLERRDAYRFAQSVDWRTTLVLPVPADFASFREVNVLGQTGLLVETSAVVGGRRTRPENMVLWPHGSEVYVLRGSLRPQDLLAMAESVQ